VKRELLMLAKEYKDQNIYGWYASVKFDGTRAFWDGGVSRGMPKVNIPWANNAKDRKDHTCTGLWSRYGNVIYAPDWWLDKLPSGVMLDGELWMGRGTFQECRSVVGRQDFVGDWSRVHFQLIDTIMPNVFFQSGQIRNPNFTKYIVEDVCVAWYQKHGRCKRLFDAVPTFEEVVRSWEKLGNNVIVPTPQVRVTGARHLNELLDQEVSLGGEGLVVRNPRSCWMPHRLDSLLKVKPEIIGEGVVRGMRAGEGKYLGMMGSLIVDFGDVTFALSGFTDGERTVTGDPAWMKQHPGELCPPWVKGQFERGSVIRFKYRELTEDGIPREARYAR
jgi:DNA ligase-1